jgi:hypothetical protein
MAQRKGHGMWLRMAMEGALMVRRRRKSLNRMNVGLERAKSRILPEETDNAKKKKAAVANQGGFCGKCQRAINAC